MTQAAAVAGITIATEIAVYIPLVWAAKLINRIGVMHPAHVEVFPKRGSPHLDHTAPKPAYHVEGLGVLTCHGFGHEHIIAIKG